MTGSPRLNRDRDSGTTDSSSGPETVVTACESSPGRVVFIESGNTDGWIASDHVVAPEE